RGRPAGRRDRARRLARAERPSRAGRIQHGSGRHAPEKPAREGGYSHEPQQDGRALNRMDKRSLSERDICTKFITPALRNAGWDEMLQIREEVSFTKGRIIVRGKLVTRGKAKRADYILYYKPNIP